MTTYDFLAATRQTLIRVGDVAVLTTDCDLGRAGERAVVVEVDGLCMALVFPARDSERWVRTGTDYCYLRTL